ncbi:MAG: hypothetical protein P4M15_01445 [Alphaproteobacteria bacterium]|nr:hypothetical protein [Alphaproteobacteria bacterium]
MQIIHCSIDADASSCGNGSPIMQRMRDNGLSLIARLEKRGIPTIHVLLDKHFTPFETGVGRLIDTPPETRAILEQFPGMQSVFPLGFDALVAYKRTYSLCGEPAIEAYIRQNRFSTVILSGRSEAENELDLFAGIHCVTESARDLAKFCNAIIAADTTNYTQGRSLRERRDLHARFGAQVETVEAIIAGIDAAKRPARGMGRIFTARKRGLAL